MNSLAFLYGGNLESVPTMPMVPVPGYPKFQAFPAPSASDETDTPERFARLFVPDFIREFEFSDGSMAICNKRMPHSITDAMIIQSDAEIRSRYRDLSYSQQNFVLTAALEFIRYISDPDVCDQFALGGGYVHLTYNTSAETLDRENGMGYTKRFHLHLNYWRRQQFEGISPVPLGSLGDETKTELLDPFTDVTAEWLRYNVAKTDLFSHRRVVGGFEEARLVGLPPGFAVEFPDWSFLTDPTFREELVQLQEIVFSTFADVQEAFTGRREAADTWTRHPLLPEDTIRRNLRQLDMPASVRARLERLAHTLRSISSELGQFFRRHKSARIRNLMMNGPNFSIGFLTLEPNFAPYPIGESRSVWLMLQFKMLSTLGSAGVFCNGLAPIVRIARNSREVSREEEHIRQAFQRGFAERLPKHPATAEADV